MAPSLARLLNDAPEFATGDPQEPLQALDPCPLAPEPARECVELDQVAAVDACHAALRAMLDRLGRGDRHGS